jgi:hypothetical protein
MRSRLREFRRFGREYGYRDAWRLTIPHRTRMTVEVLVFVGVLAAIYLLTLLLVLRSLGHAAWPWGGR